MFTTYEDKPIEELSLDDFYDLTREQIVEVLRRYTDKEVDLFYNKYNLRLGRRSRESKEKTAVTLLYQPALPMYYDRQRPMVMRLLHKATTRERIISILGWKDAEELIKIAVLTGNLLNTTNQDDLREHIVVQLLTAKGLSPENYLRTS